VEIVYSSKTGLPPDILALRDNDGHLWKQSDPGGVDSSGDRFAAALAPGDFNRDGKSDLAVSIGISALQGAHTRAARARPSFGRSRAPTSWAARDWWSIRLRAVL